MELIRAGVYLHFGQPLHPWLELRNVTRALTDDKSARVRGEPIRVRRAEDKLAILLEPQSVRIDLEGEASIDRATHNLVRELSNIHTISPLPNVRMAHVDYMSIEPFPLPFQELVTEVKRGLLHPSNSVNLATDVGVNFDIQGDEVHTRVQLGPMEPSQLNSRYILFERDDLPKAFLFLGLSQTCLKVPSFSVNAFRKFLSTSFRFQADLATDFAAQVSRHGG